MTERDVQCAIFNDIRSASLLVVPNFTPNGWWECDVWSVTKAGFAVEHEIKLTRSDFKVDSKKSNSDDWRVRRGLSPLRNKHALLADGSPQGPSRFWFVVPVEIAEGLEVPEWAGLKTARLSKNGWCFSRIAKVAPRLHKQPTARDEIDRAKGVFYWRYWSMARREAEKRASGRATPPDGSGTGFETPGGAELNHRPVNAK